MVPNESQIFMEKQKGPRYVLKVFIRKSST